MMHMIHITECASIASYAHVSMLYKYIMCKLHMFVFSSKDASGATTVSAQKVNRTEYDQTRVGAWNGLRPPAKRTMGDPKAKAKGHSQGLPKSKKQLGVPLRRDVDHILCGRTVPEFFIDELKISLRPRLSELHVVV